MIEWKVERVIPLTLQETRAIFTMDNIQTFFPEVIKSTTPDNGATWFQQAEAFNQSFSYSFKRRAHINTARNSQSIFSAILEDTIGVEIDVTMVAEDDETTRIIYSGEIKLLDTSPAMRAMFIALQPGIRDILVTRPLEIIDEMDF